MILRSLSLLPGNKECAERVEERHDGGDGKKGPHAEAEPDPAPHRGGDDGNEMVDGYTR